MSSKIQCIISYPSKTSSGSATKFDLEYYLANHMATIDQFWTPHGMKSWSVAEFPPANPLDGSERPYVAQTTIEWKSLQGLKDALAAPEGAQIRDDLARFTDVRPVIWVNSVVGKSSS